VRECPSWPGGINASTDRPDIRPHRCDGKTVSGSLLVIREESIYGLLGHAAKAAIEEAHARVCERRTWVCNEKGLLETAGLEGMNALFRSVPSDSTALVSWIDRVGDQLGAESGDVPSWKR
jgi:hypothetical protein